jgi:hypothetical protein
VSRVGLPRIYLDISILACFCHIGGATWLLVFAKCGHSIFIKELILKPYTKFEFMPNNQTKSSRRGESLPGKPGGVGFVKPVAPVLGSVVIPLQGASPEILEISPEIPDFPEIPEKSPENPGFTDNFVLSGDFSRLAYSTPPLGDIKILSAAF